MKFDLKLSFQIRTIGMSINTLAMYASSFVISKYFPIMCEMIGMYGCLSLMSAACILGIIFVIFVMEETNGRSLDSIESATKQPKTTSPVPNSSNV